VCLCVYIYERVPNLHDKIKRAFNLCCEIRAVNVCVCVHVLSAMPSSEAANEGGGEGETAKHRR